VERRLSPSRKIVSYKDSLVGEIPGAYLNAFRFVKVREDEEDSDTKREDLTEGMADVKLSKETKLRIRAP